MQFHINIKDNETGEVLFDADTDGILAAIDEENSTRNFQAVHCDLKGLLAMMCTLNDIVAEIRQENPIVDAFMAGKNLKRKGD
jgi:hypothetical protein